MATTFNYLGHLARVVPWSSLSGWIEHLDGDKNFFPPQRKMRCQYEHALSECSAQYMHAKVKDRWKKTKQGQYHYGFIQKILCNSEREMTWYVLRNRTESSWCSFFPLVTCFFVVTWLNHMGEAVSTLERNTQNCILFFRQSSVNEDSVIRGSLNAFWLQQLWFFPNPRS